MEKIIPTGAYKEIMDSYDGKNYKIWRSTDKKMQEVRTLIREHYLVQQRYMCAYCRQEKKEKHGLTWDVEHILPASLYPQFLFEPTNLAISCKECNNPKDNHDILKGGLPANNRYPSNKSSFIIIHPHLDTYSEHIEIAVIDNKRIYRVIKTECKKGRNTYSLCDLFRFDCNYSEWGSFDDALVNHFTHILDNCPTDATPAELKRWVGTISKVVLKGIDF